MKWIYRLERRWGDHFGIPNVTIYLVAGQVAAYCWTLSKPGALDNLSLVPAQVFQGEVWRLATFLFIPPFLNPLFVLLAWWFLYWAGGALERIWGTFRYNLFLLLGWLATVLVSFVDPNAETGNEFLQLSILLAFAFLNPDYVVRVDLILPLRIKWLAALAWAGVFYAIARGEWPARLAALASIANFLLFFGDQLIERALAGRRRILRRSRGIPFPEKRSFYHRCTVCGITDQSHPKMDFRYCSKCEGTYGYCADHLKNHEHVRAAPAVPY
jgi:hypothetical protein